MLGDLVLCPEVAERQAETAGHAAEDEIHLLTVHGILHLLGYDHAEPGGAKEMFGLQDRLLAEWRAGAVPGRMSVELSAGVAFAAALVVLAGLFAGADAALSSISKARAEELSAEGTAGAKRCRSLWTTRPATSTPRCCLRLLCEIAATVLVTLLVPTVRGTAGGRC